MQKDENKHVDLDNARDGIYKDTIKKIQESAICPFCEEHLTKIHPNPIEEKKYWVVTNNAYPYKPTKQHILIIHKKHIDNINDLNPDAWIELFEIIKEENIKRDIKGGTYMMRFGETKYTGASVTHLHCHIIQSNPDDSSYDPKKGILTRVG
jgi:diadenosine tetraphosphate (Ap4A) HIT family hydrolase